MTSMILYGLFQTGCELGCRQDGDKRQLHHISQEGRQSGPVLVEVLIPLRLSRCAKWLRENPGVSLASDTLSMYYEIRRFNRCLRCLGRLALIKPLLQPWKPTFVVVIKDKDEEKGIRRINPYMEKQSINKEEQLGLLRKLRNIYSNLILDSPMPFLSQCQHSICTFAEERGINKHVIVHHLYKYYKASNIQLQETILTLKNCFT